MSKKQLNKKGILATRIVIAILVVAAAVVIFFFVRSIVDKRILLDNGEQVMGVVLAQDTHTSVSRASSLTTREISYSFTPKGSKEKVVKNDFNVSKKEYEQYPVASQIPVTYMPDDPTMNQPTVSLRHMPSVAVPFMYLILVIVVISLYSKVIKKFQTKHHIKSPSRLYYITSLGGFMVAVGIAAVFTILFSNIVSIILS